MNHELTMWLTEIGRLTASQLLFTGAAICMVGFTLAHFGLLDKLNVPFFRSASPLLVGCHVCAKKVSKNAASCPHCGEPFMGADGTAP
tara:strand:+ start:113 stop:376 length:264 start_codon:yes stop_codon:yes gene_type:complete